MSSGTSDDQSGLEPTEGSDRANVVSPEENSRETPKKYPHIRRTLWITAAVVAVGLLSAVAYYFV